MTSRLHTHAFKRNVRIFFSVALLLLAAVLVSLLVIRAFTIRDVVVDAPGMTIQLDPSRFGNNLLFLPTESLEQELLEAYPLLSDVRFEKKIPSTLIVHLVKRSTFAYLESRGAIYAVDEQGLILDAARLDAGFPVLLFDVGTPAIGSTVTDTRVLGSLSLLRVATAAGITRITDYNGQALQARTGNTNIFLPRIGDLSAKADTLQIIMEGFRIKGTLPTVIDLRYEKPIITND